MELRQKAFDTADLTGSDLVIRTLRRAARKADVPVRQPMHTITVEQPRAALREFRRTGLDDVECLARGRWLEAAERALAEHDYSFAVLPMDMLLRKDGLLAELERRGYTVQAPEQ